MRETNMERDLTIEEMIQIGVQLFPDADPQEISDIIDKIKSMVPGTTNSDILNMIVHEVIDNKGNGEPKLDNLRELMSKR